jgi:hypothetical protein
MHAFVDPHSFLAVQQQQQQQHNLELRCVGPSADFPKPAKRACPRLRISEAKKSSARPAG